MINRLYHKLNNELADEFPGLFVKNTEKKSFKFLRKYLKYIESDEECFNRYFNMENPLPDKNNIKEYMYTFNKTIGDWLDNLIKTSTSGSKKCYNKDVACYLGVAHEYGIFDKPKNPTLAFYYYTISSQLNGGMGTFRLALCYERGLGTSKNLDKAVYFYRCAAKHGLLDSMHVYGTILLNGYLGCEPSVEMGLHFLSLAASQATNIYPHALYDMGIYYERVENDQEYAYKIFQKGLSFKDPNCTFRIAQAYEKGDLGCQVNPTKAFEYYKLAADKGHVDAQICISEMYCSATGNDGKRSPTLSYSYMLKAATKNSARGSFILGEYSMNKFGVDGCMLLSLWWFKISNYLGNDDAVNRILELKSEVEKRDEGPFLQPGCCNLFC